MSPEKQIEFLLVVVLPLVVVGLILWVGCSNVANLLLARAAMRRKEIAIRVANGAGRARLVRFLLTESLVLAAAGAILGMLLVGWTLDLVRATLPEMPKIAVALDTNVFLYTSAISLLAALIFGLAPALHATRVDVAPLLKGDDAGFGQAGRSARLRTFFLVTQFASSIVLLVVAGTFVRTVISTHVGEDSALIDHLAVAYVESNEATPAGREAYWRRLREELQGVPRVSSVSFSAGAPERLPLTIEDSATARTGDRTAAVQRVDDAFFRTMGIGAVAGRAGLDGSAAIEMAAVNERAARRFWGRTDVIGRRFALGDTPAVEVAGVVSDTEDEARVYRTLRPGDLTNATILLRTAAPAVAVVPGVRTVLLRGAADRTFTRVATFREAGLGSLQRLTRLAVIVAALVLALATVGLYGSVSFVMSQRTREIAIRLAIGAPRRRVLGLMAREGLTVVAIGSAAGLALTGAAFQFMSGMIFARWSLDPLTICGVLGVLALATLIACYVPGRRALRIEPSQALRS
jgi:predicted permease